MQELRTHLVLSIAFLLLMGIGLYFAGMLDQWLPGGEGREQPFPEQRFIQVSEASWGLNCVEHLKKKRKNATLEQLNKLPKTIENNNILVPVTKLCNNTMTCDFMVSKATTGFDPAPGCRKKAEIRYRCFLLDRLQTTQSDRDGNVVIDCSHRSGIHEKR